MGTAVRDFSSLMSPFPTPVLVAHAPGRAGLAFPCTSGRATERTINGKGAHRSIAASALVSFTRPEGDEYGRSRRIQRPPIAVVEGPALGVRLEIVLACDLVVATARPAPSFRVLQAAPATVASRRPGQSGAHGRLANPTVAFRRPGQSFGLQTAVMSIRTHCNRGCIPTDPRSQRTQSDAQRNRRPV